MPYEPPFDPPLPGAAVPIVPRSPGRVAWWKQQLEDEIAEVDERPPRHQGFGRAPMRDDRRDDSAYHYDRHGRHARDHGPVYDKHRRSAGPGASGWASQLDDDGRPREDEMRVEQLREALRAARRQLDAGARREQALRRELRLPPPGFDSGYLSPDTTPRGGLHGRGAPAAPRGEWVYMRGEWVFMANEEPQRQRRGSGSPGSKRSPGGSKRSPGGSKRKSGFNGRAEYELDAVHGRGGGEAHASGESGRHGGPRRGHDDAAEWEERQEARRREARPQQDGGERRRRERHACRDDEPRGADRGYGDYRDGPPPLPPPLQDARRVPASARPLLPGSMGPPLPPPPPAATGGQAAARPHEAPWPPHAAQIQLRREAEASAILESLCAQVVAAEVAGVVREAIKGVVHARIHPTAAGRVAPRADGRDHRRVYDSLLQTLVHDVVASEAQALLTDALHEMASTYVERRRNERLFDALLGDVLREEAPLLVREARLDVVAADSSVTAALQPSRRAADAVELRRADAGLVPRQPRPSHTMPWPPTPCQPRPSRAPAAWIVAPSRVRANPAVTPPSLYVTPVTCARIPLRAFSPGGGGAAPRA